MSTDYSDICDNSGSKQSDDGPNHAVSFQGEGELEHTKNKNRRLETANRQLSTEIRQLKTENLDIQTQLGNALHNLQPLIDLNQQWIANGGGHINRNASSSSSSERALDLEDGLQSNYGANNFPAVVLEQIFSHVHDTKTLLTCRLVSASWKSVIDESAALMRKLTIIVTHPVFFMDLTNIRSKVRSIKFDNIRPFTHEQLQPVIRKIAPTLESVAFNFDKQCKCNDNLEIMAEQIKNLVSVILSQCAGLTELRIVGTMKIFMTRQIVPSNITSLTMDVKHQYEDEDQTVYENLINSLHKLTSLTLFNSDDRVADIAFDFVPVLSPVCEHMLKYPGALKKFSYDAPYHCNFLFDAGSAGQSLWTKLYLIAETNNVVINSDIVFNLENLLVFDKSYPVNVQSCSSITKARRWYYPTRTSPAPVHFKRILYCTNLAELHIDVYDDLHDQISSPVPNELHYLWQLKNLRTLSLNEDCGTISGSSFPGPVPAVRRLDVWGEVFDSTAIYSSISVYFPNLVDLTLHMTTLPEHLFISLARLEGLVKLKFRWLSDLTDTMFLTPPASKPPTIAQFAGLKHLKIVHCDKLTDKCLLYGIRFISTLQSFTVADCSGITDAGLAGITHGRLNVKTTVKVGEHERGHTYTLSSIGF